MRKVKELPDEMVLCLSDAFDETKKSQSDIDVRVRMVNINIGHNPAVLYACKPLNEYAWTVARIRDKEQEMGLEAAIDEAINTMPEDFEIKNLLEQNRAEVKGMLLMEYDEAKEMDRLKEEYLRVGKQEGKIEGTYTTLADLVKDKVITLSEAARRAGVSEKEFIKNTGLSTI